MNIYDALSQALGGVDDSNWRASLDALHDQAGSWKALSEQLGVDKRTVERWRFGYVDKKTHERRQISAQTVQKSVLPKVRKAFKASRAAQVARVDWRKLQATGSLQIADYPSREERMYIGAYLSGEAIAGIAAAYVSGDPDRVQAAMDNALGEDYIGNGDAGIGDVTDLDFG